jgi:Flp pilus assembly protein TadG
MKTNMKTYLKNSYGVMAIEFAFIFPILLLIGLGIFEFCRFLWYNSEVIQALDSMCHYLYSQPNDISGSLSFIHNLDVFKTNSNFVVDNLVGSCANTSSDLLSWSDALSLTCSDETQKYIKITVHYNNFSSLFTFFKSYIPNSINQSAIIRIQ